MNPLPNLVTKYWHQANTTANVSEGYECLTIVTGWTRLVIPNENTNTTLWTRRKCIRRSGLQIV